MIIIWYICGDYQSQLLVPSPKIACMHGYEINSGGMEPMVVVIIGRVSILWIRIKTILHTVNCYLWTHIFKWSSVIEMFNMTPSDIKQLKLKKYRLNTKHWRMLKQFLTFALLCIVLVTRLWRNGPKHTILQVVHIESNFLPSMIKYVIWCVALRAVHPVDYLWSVRVIEWNL